MTEKRHQNKDAHTEESQLKNRDRQPAGPVQTLQEADALPVGLPVDLPAHSTTRGLRQQAILQLQRTHGNFYTRRLLKQGHFGGPGRMATSGLVQREDGEEEGAEVAAGNLTSNLFRGDATLQAVSRGEDTLERGERNVSAVTRVQRALLLAGHSLGRHGADGDYGGTTERVVREFQEANEDLTPSGTVDAATLRALDQLPSTQGAEVGVRAVHMAPRSRGRAYMLDWESRHRNIAQDSTLREAFDENLVTQIERVFGEALTLEQVLERIDTAESEGRDADAQELRRNLSIANQFAVVATLNVEESARYQRVPGATYCNIYAYDVVTALGGYLPRVWWTNNALERLRNGEEVPVRYGRTVHELNANALTRWMQEFGGDFGWRQAEDVDEAQREANNGKLVILLAANSNPRRSGHVNIVMPEFGENQAVRGASGEVEIPMQSQAGSRNFEYETSSGRWWANASHRNGAAWIFEGERRSPLLPPERTRPGSNMRTAQIGINMHVVDDELFGREEQSFDIDRQVNLVPDGDPQTVSVRECVGNEVVVDLQLELTLTASNIINGNIRAVMYEGTSCATDDLEDQATERFEVEEGSQQQRNIELVNREMFGGDRATIQINISSTGE